MISLSQLLDEVVNKLVLHVALTLVKALPPLFPQVYCEEHNYENSQSCVETDKDYKLVTHVCLWQ